MLRVRVAIGRYSGDIGRYRGTWAGVAGELGGGGRLGSRSPPLEVRVAGAGCRVKVTGIAAALSLRSISSDAFSARSVPASIASCAFASAASRAST